MLNILKRIIFWLIFLAILSYLTYILINWTIIVNENFLDQNMIINILYILIFLYYFVFYVVKPTYIPKFKLRNTLIGMFILTSSQSFLTNNWSLNIYFGDIFTVIWVILTIIWPTNLLISKKLKQKKQESKMEVIEV